MKFRILPVILTASLTSIITLQVASRFTDHPFLSSDPATHSIPVNYTTAEGSTRVTSAPPADFQNAAEAAVKAVVHVKTTTKARSVSSQGGDYEDDFFGNFFGQRQMVIPQQLGSGSGVVISPDGYIVTNNHVVAGTDEVTVTFNDRYTATAKVVGTDPDFDLAVLKVTEKNLPYMELGNSDDVKLGQWVLAVGYPLTLDATVTAGIVSAKARAIGINRSARSASHAIESFIQTDAAVNPGNSGGALVNTSGQLIGINSAIASPTGSYAGYSYAIPANIVRKVTSDMMKYGSVQRAYMGIEYMDRRNVPAAELSKLGIDRSEGVYVAGVTATGGASKAGLRKGDFITQINGVAIRTEPELQEQVARYKPGDNISVVYLRNGKSNTASVQLRNLGGTTDLVREQTSFSALGATFRALTDAEKKSYGVKRGVVVSQLGSGLLSAQTNMKKGFIITSINEREVGTPAELPELLGSARNLQIAGFYPGSKGIYYYGLRNTDVAESRGEE